MGYSRWETIKHLSLPNDLANLCTLCMKFELEYEHLTNAIPYLDSGSFQKVCTYVIEIMSEYISLLDKLGISPETKKEVLADVQKNLSRFFNVQKSDAKLFIPTAEFEAARNRSGLDVFVPSYFSPFFAFINSRIYNSINGAWAKTNFEKTFSDVTLRLAGVSPIYETKKEVLIEKGEKE